MSEENVTNEEKVVENAAPKAESTTETTTTTTTTTVEAKNSMATASLVLGIIAAILAFIPLMGIFSWILAILAIIFGGIGLSKVSKTGLGKGKSITGLVLGIFSIILNIFYYAIFAAAAVGAVGAAAAEAGAFQ